MPSRRVTRVSETIVKRIQRQIFAGRLTAGEKLPAEREMARRYKTSRVSVREAYRSLVEQGVLTIRRGAEGGAFIAEQDHGAVQRSLTMALKLGRMSHEELTEARLLIEPPIARLAARRASPEDIARLTKVVERQEQMLARKRKYRTANLIFHRTLAECAHNLPLTTLMNALADLTREMVLQTDVPREVQQGVCDFHRLILDAISRHDEDAAHELMLKHIGEVQTGIGESIARDLQAGDAEGDQDASADAPQPTGSLATGS